MPVVVPVKFAYAGRDLWFDPQGLDIVEADHAICSTERGTEIGLVTSDPFEVPESEIVGTLKPVLRIATDTDLDQADELAQRGDEAMPEFRRLVKQNDLDMKPVGVEYLFGGEKVVFYFAAEDRVDFRQLVKDLSSSFHTRVDMRQIGVRDETRLVGGYAHCGQELCCTRFGGQFEPVSIRMAKEQDLPLNSAKISGMCGRLMCCLRYEFEAYKDFKSRAPKKKTLIDTPLGKAKIQEYNTPREQLVLRLENGKVFRVNLSDMTCSEGCQKRAEEQGCNCRPDCVTRDILERIESPDIALALMELDRENGVDVGDGLSHADRLDTSGSSPRRRQRNSEESSSNAGAASRGSKFNRGRGVQGAQEAADEQPQRRRRRRSSASEDAAGTSERAESRGMQSPDAAPQRRRRRHLSSEERDDAFRAAAARETAQAKDADTPATPGRSRRRRHSQASGAEQNSERAQTKPNTPSVAEQLASGEVKVTRRRPGDGGGVRASAEAPEAAGEAPKRRRRRTRKPRGGEGSDSASSSSENSSAE